MLRELVVSGNPSCSSARQGCKTERVRSLVPLAFVVGLSCSRPQPPTIAPEKATLTSIGPNGFLLDLEIGVDNPNGVELSGRSVTARVRLDAGHALGTVSV